MSLFPVASEQPTMRPAIANLTIIGLNVFVFLLEMLLGDTFIATWAFTPAQLTAFLHGSGSFQSVLTIFTSMFMHAGWSHLFGNMLFLWVFGQAIENAFGSRMYTLFYLVCGVAANMASILVDPNSTVLNLGASGAIAGVMGAYLALYPDLDDRPVRVAAVAVHPPRHPRAGLADAGAVVRRPGHLGWKRSV